MYLVRNAQEEILEVEVIGENTQILPEEALEKAIGELANVGLLNARSIEYPKKIAELQAKKTDYSNGDAEAIQLEIDKFTRELAEIPAQKASAQSRVTLYNKYV